MAVILILSIIIGFSSQTLALENGLIRTPPMGWLHWERFECQTDCKTWPDECINDKLFKTMADHLVADGYKAAGYEYVNIDDCWHARTRDAKGRLQPDPERFPKGMKDLADYIHGKGLKFGIYSDVGTKTCAGYPASQWYMETDAQTFADWNIDYLKFDGCNYDSKNGYRDGYPPMAFFLNKTGRPIALSCEYALYQLGVGEVPDYKGQAAACNVARNYGDIGDSWESVKRTIEFFGKNEHDFAAVAGPGFFNDPDMLVIGNFGLSHEQERSQMAMWCIFAAPLLMSVDLRTINDRSKALLQNKYAIAINQDPRGIQGKRINTIGQVHIWTRPITPEGSYAFVLLNLANDVPTKVTVKLVTHLLLGNSNGYNVTEVFENKPVGTFKPESTLTVTVNPNGVFFGKAIAL